MKANVRSPSFHSWQSGDEVHKHLSTCVLLGYLIDFINRRIPGNEQQKLIWQNHPVAKSPRKGSVGPTLQMQ